ncbi:exodeoxyribonuclease VII large subunit [Tatumella ptyseos]|uniref:exodeoxyribonuclease VII large subunit n=1 Tax=Tatumella ptyseos TaxID=82987 RepID=UPI0026F2F724|nr:exodeoxyribonuclease VII large subunit [Tatumella ptyseos]WKX25701.1 exodeoxyribonuclease VII large subunit [Tatumella ptyseos]
MLPTENSTIYSVAQLNGSVRQLLEKQLGRIWLSAEVSNFSRPSSGHWYFTLKDDAAQVRCAMFRGSNQRVTFQPQNGMQILVRASVTLYDPRGDYQLIVESMHPAGEGLLQQQFQALKRKLDNEGLFAQSRKRPLPVPATRVGVITSPSGAALHDILHVLRRRDPALPVVIYPTAVQGKEATAALVNAILLANQRKECDVLIVGRGGGSLEDLWCFNEESVARAIAQSEIPVVSAVGHETDVTIADFVADLRAPTPSAAAEMVSRNQVELVRQLQGQQQRLEMAFDYYHTGQQQRLTALTHRLTQQHPQLRLVRQQSQLQQQQRRMQDALHRQLQRAQQGYDGLTRRLNRHLPSAKIAQHQQSLAQQRYRLQIALRQQVEQRKQRFGNLAVQLEAVSPLGTLARGYSVTTGAQGEVVRKTKDLRVGDKLRTRLEDGWAESEVLNLKKTRRSSAKKTSST